MGLILNNQHESEIFRVSGLLFSNFSLMIFFQEAQVNKSIT